VFRFGAKIENDKKRSSGKGRTPLLSFIYFCLGVALSACFASFLFGYDFIDMFIDLFALPEILLYVAVGGGLLLAHILTRESRKRPSKNSPEQEGKE
jgi:hypothetical protein